MGGINLSDTAMILLGGGETPFTFPTYGGNVPLCGHRALSLDDGELFTTDEFRIVRSSTGFCFDPPSSIPHPLLRSEKHLM